MPSLFVIDGRDQGKRYELDEPTIYLGRDTSSDIQLNDTEVSRKHAELLINEDKVEVVDLGSSNGTYVNGERVQHASLSSGDRLQLGRTLMLFTEAPSPTAVAQQVDIVRQGIADSQILRSIPPDAGLFDDGPIRKDGKDTWLARARSNLQIMYRTSLAVSHTMDIDQLLAKIMNLILEWVDADRGVILLADRESKELRVTVHRDRGADSDEAPETSAPMRISQTILDYVREKQEGVLTSDAREDQRFDQAGSIITMGVREAICVPMQGRYGNVGIIYIDTFTSPGQALATNQANQFTEDHLKLMMAIGHQAALAVEDTSYYSAMLQAERLAAIGQTIAGLSHHVKNILQGIRGGSYLIEEGLKDSDTELTTRGWRIVEKNQERISALVMDMLTFSKDRQPEMVPSELNEIVADVLDLMKIRAVEAEVKLVDERSAKIPELVFDGEGLHRAILNVVTNAIDACSEAESDNKVVRVSTNYDKQAKRLSVVVSDTGPGIPEGEVEQIFGLFESQKGSRGTGLGLPVSRKILREHGGDIKVVSEVGMGSIFTLTWPASKGQRSSSHHETGVIGDPEDFTN